MRLANVNMMLREMVEMRMKEVPQLTLKDVQAGFPDRATARYSGDAWTRMSTAQSKQFKDYIRKLIGGGKLTYDKVLSALLKKGLPRHVAKDYAFAAMEG
jgi:hypothetical protein